MTAFHDEPAAARKAVDDLAAAGVDRHRIALVEGGLAPDAFGPVPSRDRTIWDAVKGLFMADEDRHACGEGLRRGGMLLSVTTAGDDARVIEVLDREGAVDMDARQGTWELEGWDPPRASADLAALSPADVRSVVGTMGAAGRARRRSGRPPPAPLRRGARSAGRAALRAAPAQPVLSGQAHRSDTVQAPQRGRRATHT